MARQAPKASLERGGWRMDRAAPRERATRSHWKLWGWTRLPVGVRVKIVGGSHKPDPLRWEALVPIGLFVPTQKCPHSSDAHVRLSTSASDLLHAMCSDENIRTFMMKLFANELWGHNPSEGLELWTHFHTVRILGSKIVTRRHGSPHLQGSKPCKR